MLPAERLLACYQQALGHDLPNKLVALQGLARLLGDELAGQLSGDTRECLERVVSLTRQIHEQIANLAEIGRACRQPGPVTPLGLEALWAEIGAEITCLSPERELQFTSKGPLPRPIVPGRAARRVLQELALHAVRRTPGQSPLHLTLGCQASSVETLLSVHDDGPTPAPAELANSLEARLDDPRGPALGLFLVSLLVQGWGGTFRLTAPSEGGCLALVQLPSAET